MIFKIAYIGQVGSQWRVYSKTGKNLGTFNSYQAANKHLKEVEMFKHMKNKKRKKAFQNAVELIKQSKEVETTTTFSSTMRQLRKDSPNKVKSFMEIFKKAFDAASEQKLDDVEQIALLEALQSI